MQLLALLCPIGQIIKAKRYKKKTDQALRDFDKKKADGPAAPDTSAAATSVNTGSSRGTLFTVETLEDCIFNKTSDFQPFYEFCRGKCLCAENVIFLDKAMSFKREWARIFSVPGETVDNARLAMYRVAVQIYLYLIHEKTAQYSINVEGNIKAKWDSLFRTVAERIAADRPSTSKSANAAVTPWDEVSDPFTNPGNDHPLRPLTRRSIDKGSSTDLLTEINLALDAGLAFSDLTVPDDFNEACFDRGMDSIKHMLWSQQWQQYMRTKRGSAASVPLAVSA